MAENFAATYLLWQVYVILRIYYILTHEPDYIFKLNWYLLSINTVKIGSGLTQAQRG
jgi:hypothetical protein